MSKLIKYKSVRIVSAIAASTAGIAVGSLAMGQTAAHADPPYVPTASPLVGVGSNTLEDLVNAWTGETPTPGVTNPVTGVAVLPKFYTPIADPIQGERLYSFDAENPYAPTNTSTVGCITTKLGGNAFDRPNGSGAGYVALSDAFNGGKWYEGSSKGPKGCDATQATQQSVSGQIDFSRASKSPTLLAGSSNVVSSPTDANCGPSGSNGVCLTGVVVGHDAVTYAFWAGSGAATAAQSISYATLKALYSATSGNYSANGITYYDCLPQLSSGTVGFFLTQLGNLNSTNTGPPWVGSSANGCAGTEENNGDDFYNKVHAKVGTPAANTVWVTPFAVGQWVAQNNGTSQDVSSAARSNGIDLGDIGDPSGTPVATGTGSYRPYSISGSTFTADAKFETNDTWGRDIWVLVPWYLIDDDGSGTGGSGSPSDSPEYAYIFGSTDTYWGTIASGGPGGSTPIGTGGGQVCAAPGISTTLNQFGFTTYSQLTAAGYQTSDQTFLPCGAESTVKPSSTSFIP